MADVEKVIKGLERCLKHTCPAIYSKEYKECEYTVGLYCGQDKLLHEALELLKELKEKREDRDIPMKPVHRDWDQEEFFCGKCGMNFKVWYPHTYCGSCGQAIDMSDVEK